MLFLTAASSGSAGSMTSLIMLALMFVLLYFIMIRPERKKKKEADQMRDALKVGDEITTIGGIVGEVCHIKDDNIVIEVGADRVRMEFKKWAIASNESAAAAAMFFSLGFNVVSMAAMVASVNLMVSIASKRPSLSSCKSRL